MLTTAKELRAFQIAEQHITAEQEVAQIIEKIKNQIRQNPKKNDFFLNKNSLKNKGSLTLLEELGYTVTGCTIYYPDINESYSGHNIKWDEHEQN